MAMEQVYLVEQEKKTRRPTVKCVVWDLDNTLWDGVLLEDEHVTLRPGVVATLQELDRRGILHSIASRNDYATAMRKLEQFGLSSYFLYPQINWNPKSASLQTIAKSAEAILAIMQEHRREEQIEEEVERRVHERMKGRR